ncbi:MAG: Uma2 family endonuclease [Akkermansiaceae bacterium]|nr:Uma2 family endonuclease [Armatimonadota bacterium]
MAVVTQERPSADGGALRPAPPTRPAKERITFAEYMERERKSDIKHNFVDGVMEPAWGDVGGTVSGASFEHNLICKNLTLLFGNALYSSACETLGSDMRVEVSDNRLCYYPDLVIVCGDPQITPDECLQNPILIVEVLSSSTATKDRTTKSRQYRAINSLRHYVLVDQYEPLVEHYERQGDGKWVVGGEYDSLDDTWQLTVGTTVIAIPLAEIYRRVSFPENDPAEIEGE